MTTLRERCLACELLVLDVDGVLTEGGIVHGGERETKTFHVRDGSGIKVWRGRGKRLGIITGRRTEAVATRAAELGITDVVQGAGDKMAAFTDMLKRKSVAAHTVAYIGDDLPDLDVLCACGLAIAPADACPEARQMSHYVTQARAGHGAVREAIELILRCQGLWGPTVSG